MIRFKRTSQTLLFLTVGVVMANVAEAIKTEPVKAGPVKTESPKKQDSERFEPIGIDRRPPVITTDAPLVASSNNVKFTTTMSDNVELAYTIPSGGGIVPIDEGIKNYQYNDSANISIGQTISRILMAVDTSGNVTKKTISIKAPETAIKLGGYSTVATYSLPTGFNCLSNPVTDDGAPQDGAIVMGMLFSANRNNLPWSEVDGYSPEMNIQINGARVYIANNGDPADPNHLVFTPFSATSLTFPYKLFGSGFNTRGAWWYSYGYTASAILSSTNPPTLNITLYMECNENNVGFVNGTTATFSVSLNPPV